MSSDPTDPTPTTYTKLVAADGHTFVIATETACISPTLASTLRGGAFAESSHRRVALAALDAPVLDRVADYLCYNAKHANAAVAADASTVPDFPVPTEMALEVLVAADYLHL